MHTTNMLLSTYDDAMIHFDIEKNDGGVESRFFSMSQLNNLLTKNEKQFGFRTEDVFVYYKSNDVVLQAYEENQKVAESLQDKIDDKDLVSDLTQEEREFVQKFAFIALSHKEIEPAFRDFFTEFQKKLQNKDDLLSVAAYAHRESTKIHPYRKANGRTARFLMNVILLQHGFPAVVFLNDDEYTKAVQQGDKDIHSFETYLLKKIEQIKKLKATSWLDNPQFCKVCKDIAFTKCSQCKTTYYCSKDCQKGDWSCHKYGCVKK